MKITVLLADDHTVVREGLKLLLNSADDVEVVGEVENGRQAVQMAKKLHPDVVVLDLVMPVLNGVEAARQITREVPSTRVLVLSSYSDDERVQQLIEDGAPERFAQRAGNDVDPAHHASILVCPPPGLTKKTGGMRVVDHGERVVFFSKIANRSEIRE